MTRRGYEKGLEELGILPASPLGQALIALDSRVTVVEINALLAEASRLKRFRRMELAPRLAELSEINVAVARKVLAEMDGEVYEG